MNWNVITGTSLGCLKSGGLLLATMQDGHKIWFSGVSKKHQQGVEFIVRNEITHSVISSNPISSKLISIRVSARPHNMPIIQAYVPTVEHDEIIRIYTQKRHPERHNHHSRGLECQGRTGCVRKLGRNTRKTNDRDFSNLPEVSISPGPTLCIPIKSPESQPKGKFHNQIDFYSGSAKL